MIERLKALRSRLAFINDKINLEQARPRPDILYLTTLKRRRLNLRDKIKAGERLLSSGKNALPAEA